VGHVVIRNRKADCAQISNALDAFCSTGDNNCQDAVRSWDSIIGNLRAILATAHTLSTADISKYRRIKVIAVSCTVYCNVVITSEAPKLSCSIFETAELIATRAIREGDL
jgi:hypothetical protein